MSAYRENHVVGSKAATAAALWAADCAIRRGAALHLVHVCQTDVAAYPGQGMIPPDTRELAMEAGRSILIAARQAVTAAHPGLPVTAAAVPGAVVAELRDFAARALLTVLGTTGTGQLADVALGSVASRMVGRCGSPIVVVPWRPDGAPQSCDGPVVAGLDASADSDAALGFAFEEAAARHVSLVAVRSWDDKVLDRNLSSYPLAVDKAGWMPRRPGCLPSSWRVGLRSIPMSSCSTISRADHQLRRCWRWRPGRIRWTRLRPLHRRPGSWSSGLAVADR